MKYTIVGDPHCKLSKIDTLGTLFNTVESMGNTVVWLGDMLDTKSVIRGECLNFWVRQFRRSRLTHYVLVGNHDYFNLECEDHALVGLVNLRNVEVVDKVHKGSGGAYFLPYIHDEASFKREVSKIPAGAVLFCHPEVSGFDFGTGLEHKSSILEVGIFAHLKRVYGGHFHLHQKSGNFMYLGTPLSDSFGESDQEKFIGVYDIETDDLKLIPTGLPQHRTLTVDCDVPYNPPLPPTSKVKDIWRLILTGTLENIQDYKIPEWMIDIGAKIVKRPSELKDVILEIPETSTPRQQFGKWGREVKELSEEAVGVGLQILKEVTQ